MSTVIGLIAEGPIDQVLIPPLLSRIADLRADITWPVSTDDVAQLFPVRKRGHGGVLDTTRKLVKALDSDFFPHAFFVILLDRRTRETQREIRKLIRPHPRFVMGVAIEEIEAWWLGDRTNTLRWAADPLNGTRYMEPKYHAERDDDPKRTLDEITMTSAKFDRRYGAGNLDQAREFVDEHWQQFASLDEIRTQCSNGYGPFEQEVAARFRNSA